MPTLTVKNGRERMKLPVNVIAQSYLLMGHMLKVFRKAQIESKEACQDKNAAKN